MAIVLRLVKGSELTFAELDGNFTDLDGRVTANLSSINGLTANSHVQGTDQVLDEGGPN